MDDFLLFALFLTSTIIRFSSDKNEVISDRTVVNLGHLIELPHGDQALNGRALDGRALVVQLSHPSSCWACWTSSLFLASCFKDD